MKILVIGFGSIGKRHVNNLLKISNLEVIVFTKSKKILKKKNLSFYSSLKECLAQNPDAAIIANVTSEHLTTAKILAKNNIHMLIEKPLSNSYHGVKELISLVRKKKIITLMGCQLRFHPCLKKIKEIISEDKIGKIISVKVESGSYLPNWHPQEDYRMSYAARKELGGGVVLTCIHEVDYLYWFFGRVKEIMSMTGKFSDLDINAEDLSAILLKFQNRIVAEVHLDYFQRPEFRSCKIIGTKGTIYWNSEDNLVKIYDIKKKRWIEKLTLSSYDRNQMFIDELSHFLYCVTNRTKSINPIEHGTETLKISLGILKSAKLKRLVNP